jgi:hypothetical protein
MFKRLNQLLDSEPLLRELDATTLRIRQTDKGVPGRPPQAHDARDCDACEQSGQVLLLFLVQQHCAEQSDMNFT